MQPRHGKLIGVRYTVKAQPKRLPRYLKYGYANSGSGSVTRRVALGKSF